MFRQVNKQLDDANVLWQSIYSHNRTDQLKRLREVKFDAKEILADVDDKYHSLKQSLFKAVSAIQSIEGSNISLIDMVEFVV